MKLAIVGSRSFTDYILLEKSVPASTTEIISGGAKGADSLAAEYAKNNETPLTVCLPKFKTDKTIKYHPRWYLERNQTIIDKADKVLAFWDGKSKGTKFTIDYARKTNKPVKIIHI